jgi:hypothetical protein
LALRVCLVTHEANSARQFRGIVDALDRRFDLALHFVDRGWPERIEDVPEHDSYDAVIFEVKFRALMQRTPFDWGRYAGARIMLDLDAFQSYSPMITRQYLGTWPGVFRANGFHVLVCTGATVRDRLLEDGVHAVWMPKAYDGPRLYDTGDHDRSERPGYFGWPYAGRRLMLQRLERAGIEYESIRCPYAELNAHLNRFRGIVICNMEVRGARRIPMRVLKRVPPPLMHETPGIEPMAKNFEVPAAGAAPICDAQPDLEALGFRDGETMVSYRSFDELIEKLRHYYGNDPDELRDIGRRASTMVRAHHSWDHRAAQLDELISSGGYLPSH